MNDGEKTGAEERVYPIGAFARLTGVTERTLRFYDRKGLLKPTGRNAQGHRYYTERDLQQLQRILTLKYLDFSLEEIAGQLREPAADLQSTLNHQYDQLQRKKIQIERALETIDRLRASVDNADKADAELLLMFIHNIQNEERQKRYLAEWMPAAFVEAIFLEDLPKEEKLAQERKLSALLIELLSLRKAGRDPEDEQVLAVGRELTALLGSILEPAYSRLSEQELNQVSEMEDRFDPVLFQSGLSPEDETFLEAVFKRLEAMENGSGVTADGS